MEITPALVARIVGVAVLMSIALAVAGTFITLGISILLKEPGEEA